MRYLIILAVWLLGVGFVQAPPADWVDPVDMQFDTIEFRPAAPTEATLSNGIRVFLTEDHALPIIQGTAFVDAKSVFDPADKVGLASFTANLLREGGAGGRSPDEIDNALEFIAASVEASATAFYSSVSFESLTDTLPEVLPIWRDVLVSPDFDEGRIEIERQRQLEGILRIVDNPVQLAVREFYFRVAEGHPSGAYATADTVGAITRDDLLNFHASYYQPQATTVAITGDFEAEAMLELLEDTLGAWQGEAVAYPELPALDEKPAPKIYYAPKDIEQSIILIGHPSVVAYSPEYNDLEVAIDILGAGGFYSRLFNEIRTRRGLAYSTGAFQTQGFDYPGDFVAYSISRADATGEVLEALLAEVEKLQNAGVTPEELERSRQSILNSSLFRFTSPAAVTERAARIGFLGLEPGYYETYLENVQSITPEDVQAIMQRIIRPAEMVIMVVGNAEAFDRPLEDFGEVVTIDLE